jgi:hypothetical protein
MHTRKHSTRSNELQCVAVIANCSYTLYSPICKSCYLECERYSGEPCGILGTPAPAPAAAAAVDEGVVCPLRRASELLLLLLLWMLWLRLLRVGCGLYGSMSDIVFTGSSCIVNVSNSTQYNSSSIKISSSSSSSSAPSASVVSVAAAAAAIYHSGASGN